MFSQTDLGNFSDLEHAYADFCIAISGKADRYAVLCQILDSLPPNIPVGADDRYSRDECTIAECERNSQFGYDWTWVMLERFRENFRADPGTIIPAQATGRDAGSDLDAISTAAGGYSFERGLYRLIRPQDRSEWAERVALAFPNFAERVACFGFDWLGRAFGVDRERIHDGQPGVVMLDPGTAESLPIPVNIVSFHDSELIDHGNAALALSFFRTWQDGTAQTLPYDRCVGYKKPLFLGGEDTIDNVEVSSINVYWHILGQTISRLRQSG